MLIVRGSMKILQSKWFFLFLVLCFVCVSGLLLFMGTVEVGGKRFSAVNVSLSRVPSRMIHIVFSHDIHDPKSSYVAGSVKMQPQIKGQWQWITPSFLRFQAEEYFPENLEVQLDLQPQLFAPDWKLDGIRSFTLHGQDFYLQNIEVQELPVLVDNKPFSIIEMNFSFTHAVNPEELLKFLQLEDPLQPNKNIDLQATTSYDYGSIRIKSEPLQRLPEKRNLLLTLRPGLTPQGSLMKLRDEVNKKIPLVFDFEMRLLKIERESRLEGGVIRLRFSSAISVEEAKSRLRVSPSVDFSVKSEGQVLVLQGDFRAGKSYELEIQKDLQAIDGAKFSQAEKQTVVFPNLSPSVDFAHDGLFLSASGMKKLVLENVNAEKVHVVVDRVYPNNLFYLFGDYGYEVFRKEFYQDGLTRLLGSRVADIDLTLPYSLNEKKEVPLDLEDFFKTGGAGLYRIGIYFPGNFEGKQRWVLLTDTGLVAKQGNDEIGIWASSLKNLQGIAGAKITVLSRQNQVLASGMTDNKGIFWKKGLKESLKKHTPFMAICEKNGDMAFLLFDRFKVDTTGLDVGGADIVGGAYTAFVYGERDLYRPGDTVNGMMILRDKKLEVPKSMPVTLHFIDPRGRKIDSQFLQSGLQGEGGFSLALSKTALTGRYAVQAVVGENVVGLYSFQVEEFVPDKIRVDIDVADLELTPGRDYSFQIRSQYLFGAVANSLPVTGNVRLFSATFAPKGFEDFLFGTSALFKEREIFYTDTKLDENGELKCSFQLPDDLQPPAALQAVISARVEKNGGRGVMANYSLPVHIYSAYPGLKKLPKENYSPREEVQGEVILVTPDGKNKQSGSVEVQFFQDCWETVLRRTPSGGYRYESVCNPQFLRSEKVEIVNGKGVFRFSSQKIGSYRFVVKDEQSGAMSEQSFLVSGWGYSPWAITHPAKLELVPDKKDYQIGQVAKIQVRSPFSGKMLVTVEGENVQKTMFYTLKDNTAEIELPIEATYSPNVYVTAMLVRSAKSLEPGAVARAFGSVPIFVELSKKQQKITLSLPEKIRPHQVLPVHIQTEPDSLVTVSIVDEGICQILGGKVPNPFLTFYGKRKLGVTSFDTFSFLFPNTAKLFEKSPAGGGDGSISFVSELRAKSALLRMEGVRLAKAVVFWSGPLKADAKGHVKLDWKVEDFQGAVRVHVVSCKNEKFAARSQIVQVSSPLVVMPVAPRFMGLNENLDLPVTVMNRSGKSGKYMLEVKGSGALSCEQKVECDLEKDGETTIFIPVVSKAVEGQAKFELIFLGEGEKIQTHFSFPVLSRLPVVKLEKHGTLEECTQQISQETESVLLPQSVSRTLRIGATPWVLLGTSLQDLLAYPYGCTEQAVSRAFPLLYFDSLARELTPEFFKNKSVSFMVQNALETVRSRQTANGGFSFWDSGREAEPWISIYATHFLLEAQRVGYGVDSFFLKQALKYLAHIAKEKNESEEGLRTRAYALYVLALARQGDLGSMDYLRANCLQDLPVDGRYFLANAYFYMGQSEDLSKIINEFDAKEQMQPKGMYSPFRSKAIQLLCLQDFSPRDLRLALLAREISVGLSQKQCSTQEKAFGFLALGRFYKQQESQSLKASVFVDEKEFAKVDGIKPFSFSLPAKGEVKIIQQQPCISPFYQLEISGVPQRENWQPKSNGITLTTAFLDKNGMPLQNYFIQGSTVVLKIECTAEQDIANCVLQIPFPSCLEIENTNLQNVEEFSWMQTENRLFPIYEDRQNERLLVFADLKQGEKQVYYVQFRTIFVGNCMLPPVSCESMYQPELRAYTAFSEIQVKR